MCFSVLYLSTNPLPVNDSLSLVVAHPADSCLPAGVETVPSVFVLAADKNGAACYFSFVTPF